MEKVKTPKFEYKTPSVFVALIALTILFVLIILGVQFDPVRKSALEGVRSPTGTSE